MDARRRHTVMVQLGQSMDNMGWKISDLVELLGCSPATIKECKRAYRQWWDNFQWPAK